jgi:hypothetical protein
MNTRSKTNANNIITIHNNNIHNINNKILYEVNIDFDKAIESWRSNKKYIGNGTYKYICCGTTKTGKKCNRQSLANLDYCKLHNK